MNDPMKRFFCLIAILLCFIGFFMPGLTFAWHDETHLAVARAAGYHKWYNAAGADMIKLKAGTKEGLNHFVNNGKGSVIDPEMVNDQVKRYDRMGFSGHLYGAIIASVRDYIKDKGEGKYGEYHLALCAHYIGDLSQPLHNTEYNDYNERFHQKTDGIINDEILENYRNIKIYPITLNSEEDLVNEVVRIANLSLKLGERLEGEDRLMTKEEAYGQVSHSASLFKAVLKYVQGRLRQ
jgi:hypothetical protein